MNRDIPSPSPTVRSSRGAIAWRCMTRRLVPILLAPCVVAGCATTSTRLASVSIEEIRAEESIQRILVLSELARAQARLDDIAFPLLVSAVPLCRDEVGARLGVRDNFRSGFDADNLRFQFSAKLDVGVEIRQPVRRRD